jgi:hypothetical protein
MATIKARTDTVNRSRETPMSDQQLTSFLGRKIYQAMNDEDGDLSDTRIDSLNRYLGELYGSERDGYSKFVTREVLETIEWVLPSVLRVFTGGDKVVVFDPVGPEDEPRADQETDVVNHMLMKANNGDGFLALHHFFKDALMFPNAYIKAYVDEKEQVTTHTIKGVDAVGLMLIDEDEANEIVEQDSYLADIPVSDMVLKQQALMQAQAQQPPAQPGQPPAPPPPPTEIDLGAPGKPTQTMELFDITYKKRETVRKLKIEAIPGEEALVDNDCTSTNIDTADFSCHRVRKTYTELVEMGFDRELLDDVGTYEDYQWNDERTNRLFYEDEDPDAEDEDDSSMRQFWMHDCYVWVDFNGDGVGEFRHITLIGSTIFVNEETDYQPMVSMSSILMQHKHNGMSYIDIIKDLQELQTTLTRQLLDNIYRINIRRKVISQDSLIEDGTTMEAMLNIAAEWIPVRGAAQNAIVPEQTPSIIGEILPVLQHMDDRKANRTGVNPQVSLDPDVLQQSTAGAFMGALEQASQRVEMLVRIFAETGIKQLMRKVHQLTRSYPDIAATIKLRGEWLQVDPESWRDRTDMTVNVGLGFNNKQQMTGMLIQLLNIQKEALPSGLTSEREIYNTLEKLIESANLGDATQYFKDPSAPGWQPPQPQPNPQDEVFKAQAESLRGDLQRKNMEAQHKGQLDQAKVQSEIQTTGQKTTADMSAKQAELEIKSREIALKERELALKERELDFNMAVKAEELAVESRNTDADTSLKDEQALKTQIDGMVSDKEIDVKDQQIAESKARVTYESSENDDDSGDTKSDSNDT